MSEIICVTNRKLVKEDFLIRIKKICECKPRAVLLREKDLPEAEYLKLAASVKKICDEHNVGFISHTFLYGNILHLPLHKFEEMQKDAPLKNIRIGVSVHSVEDAEKAESLGADYLIAGHIFETQCKAGLKGRGLNFLEQVRESTKLPVYAIGGISPENYQSVIKSGATGACIMSSAMTAENPKKLFESF